MTAIRVYYGENPNQYFWGAAKDKLTILKNKKELVWTAMQKEDGDSSLFTDIEKQENAKEGHHHVIAGDLDEIVEKLRKQYDIEVSFNKAKRWEPNPEKQDGMPMILKRVMNLSKKCGILPNWNTDKKGLCRRFNLCKTQERTTDHKCQAIGPTKQKKR